MHMLVDFADGMLAMTVILLGLSIITCIMWALTWVVPFLLLVILISVSLLGRELQTFLNSRNRTTRLDRLRQVLIASYGVCFACWGFDVCFTFYAINVLGIASELNPLGWPLGIVGALIFYVPAFFFTYFLLFRMKREHSVLAAIVVTVLALYIGFMNFVAAGQNLSLILTYLTPPSLLTYVSLLAVLAVIDVVYTFAFVKLSRVHFSRKPSFWTITTILWCAIFIVGVIQPAYTFISSYGQGGQPSFELSRFFVASTYSGIEIYNNGSAAAYNVAVTYSFLRRVNASQPHWSYEWSGGGRIPQIKTEEKAILTVSVGLDDIETAFPNATITDFGAYVTVSCTHNGIEIGASFELESLEVAT